MCGRGHVHGKGACVVGVCVWQREGHSWWGACVAGGHVWWGVCMAHIPPADTTRYGDTVNERAVCILLECILVFS